MVAIVGEDRDASGRRNRLRPIATGKRITLQERDWLWLQRLHEHGPLPSSFLLQLAVGYGQSEKRARERLTDLFNESDTAHGGPYLARPPQQFATIDSRYNQLVYDLAPAGVHALKERLLWDGASNPQSGPWLHQLMTSSITASIRLAAERRPDLRYISQSEILRRAQAELRFPVTFSDHAGGEMIQRMLIPDALFGLEYRRDDGNRYRFFLVEADRATEPGTSHTFHRKSALRNILQYREYVGRGRYKEHLKLTAPLLVLNVCAQPSRVEQLLRLATDASDGGNSYMLYQGWPSFATPFRPPRPNGGLISEEWRRGGKSPMRIDAV